MSWYRFHAYSGKGHQSKHETYRWYDGDRPETDFQDEWETWTEEEHCREHIQGSVEKVDVLPGKERLRFIREALDQIEEAQAMLARLGE